MLVREPLAGTSATRLDFVENENEPMFVAQRAQTLKEFDRRDIDAPFALNRFEHDTGSFIVNRRFHSSKIAVIAIDETGNEGFKPFVIFRLRRGGYGAHRTAVERVVERNDLVLSFGRVQTRELNSRFVRFGAGITEERLSSETAF